ncbi:MAG: flagellar biosynthetic protein FliR [Kofleriaceae bacterium]
MEALVPAFALALARVAGLAFTAPLLGDASTSRRVRLVFVVAIAAMLAPLRLGAALSPALPPALALELAAGLIAGTCARFVMARVETAGHLIGLSLGLGFAAQYQPSSGASASTTGILANTLGGLAFLAAGGLEAVVVAAAGPTPSRPDDVLLRPDLRAVGADALRAGLVLAGPVVAAALVANVGLALMNRAAPAINVFSINLIAVLLIGGLVVAAVGPQFVAGALASARTATEPLLRGGTP